MDCPLPSATHPADRDMQSPFTRDAADIPGTAADTPAGPPVRPWLTVWLTVAAMLAAVVVSSVVIALVLIVGTAENPVDARAWTTRVETDGDLLSAITWAGLVVEVPLVLVFARVVSGPWAASHLGFRMPGARSLARWLLATAGFVVVVDVFTWLVGRDVVPAWMLDTYAATQYPALLWATVLVAAPVGEELLFRGFLFDGLARSRRIGPVLAAGIAALAWASLHLQYDILGIATIFAVGMLLAAARHYTRSIVPCIAMHALMNLIATIEAVWLG